MDTQLNPLYRQLAALGRSFGAERILLFGSRARGDHRERSDIDLAVYGLAQSARSSFEDAVEALPTLLSFDIVFMDSAIAPELRKNIERDGINLMTKFNEKYAQFCLAVDRLAEAVNAYHDAMPVLPQEIMRDAIIQRFEFSAELAWKTAREYLLEEGVANINTPKAVMREAYAAGLVDDGAQWSDLLSDRNRTSHTYNEQTAREIFARICTDYLALFQQLSESLKKK